MRLDVQLLKMRFIEKKVLMKLIQIPIISNPNEYY